MYFGTELRSSRSKAASEKVEEKAKIRIGLVIKEIPLRSNVRCVGGGGF